jgi:hypothetical protein
MYSTLVDSYQGFYHGPVVSKIWLCEKLEEVIGNLSYQNPSVHILGCWQNVLAFMMQVRKPNYYSRIDGYDLDKLSIDASDRICDAWKFGKSKVFNHNVDFYDVDFSYKPNSVFINCSVDQFKDTTWFDKIPANSLVTMQTTDIVDDNPPWQVTQKYKDLNEFSNSYPLTEVLFSGAKPIKYYADYNYNRLMLIGIK